MQEHGETLKVNPLHLAFIITWAVIQKFMERAYFVSERKILNSIKQPKVFHLLGLFRIQI